MQAVGLWRIIWDVFSSGAYFFLNTTSNLICPLGVYIKIG